MKKKKSGQRKLKNRWKKEDWNWEERSKNDAICEQMSLQIRYGVDKIISLFISHAPFQRCDL